MNKYSTFGEKSAERRLYRVNAEDGIVEGYAADESEALQLAASECGLKVEGNRKVERIEKFTVIEPKIEAKPLRPKRSSRKNLESEQ